MKKFFAITIAIVMIMAMTTTAFAAEDTTTVYFDIGDTDFGTVYCYAWETGNPQNSNSGWPGVEMTHVTGSIYRIELANSLNTIIFNNNNIQTDDLTRPTNGNDLYTYSTKAWSTYAPYKGAGDYTIGVSGAYTPGANAADIVSVDVAWDSMNFTYSEGTLGIWSPESHSYSSGTAGGWSTDKAGITVTNHSNVGVDATFKFEAANGVTTTGSFYASANATTALTAADQKLNLATAVGTTKDNAPAGTLYFGVSGEAISENKTLGTITVTIAKDTKIYTGEALAAALTALGTTGGTITLGGDVTLPENAAIDNLNICMFSVADNKQLVLDLNGHTVNGVIFAASEEGDGNALFTVQNGKLEYTTTSSAVGDGGIISGYRVNTQINKVTITASGAATAAIIDADMAIIDSKLYGGKVDDFNEKITVVNGGDSLTLSGNIFIDGNFAFPNATIKAEAGTYNFDPTAYVDTNSYTVTVNADGTWTVSAKTSD